MTAAETSTFSCPPFKARNRSMKWHARLIVQPPPDCFGSSIHAHPAAGYRDGGPAIKRKDK